MRKAVSLLDSDIVWTKCHKIFLKAVFSHLRELFLKFQHKIFVIILRNIIDLEKFILSFTQS